MPNGGNLCHQFGQVAVTCQQGVASTENNLLDARVSSDTAKSKIDEGEGDVSFYEAKLLTARFYFERLLPRTVSLKQTMLSGADNLMQMPEALFDF